MPPSTPITTKPWHFSPTDEAEKKNHVIDCVQTGYLLNDKVLRHAKVVVGQ